VRTGLRPALTALVIAGLIQGPAIADAAGGYSPVGLVLQADRARVGDDWAATGATVFDGERLWTDNAGSLRVRLGGSQAYLPPKSAAIVHQGDGGFDANLQSGTVVLSSASGDSFHLTADGATIQPHTNQPTVAQVTLVSPSELLLYSRRGALEVFMEDQLEIVPEGGSYRMMIQPAEPSPQGPEGYPYTNSRSSQSQQQRSQSQSSQSQASQSSPLPQQPSAAAGKRSSRRFLLLTLGAAAAAGLGAGIWQSVQALQAPVSVQSPSAP
jgi:hypothetical protein